MKNITSKYQKLLFLLKNMKSFRLLVNAFFTGYLYDTGWSRSVIEKKPVDKVGDALPWISIPTIEILKEVNMRNLFVFEYGSGNSTIWFSQRVRKIVSIEHDKSWYEYQSNQPKKENTNVLYRELDYNGSYSQEIAKYQDIDIALIDGRDRVNCSINAVKQLSKKGIIILDDSQRENYTVAKDYLLKQDFRELKLVGMNLGSPRIKATSIFYKNNNCLGL